MRSLRYPGEDDEAFAARAERAAHLARALIDGALGNECVQDFIEDPELGYSLETVRAYPDVRVEYEQAMAIGPMATCLRYTDKKHWGDGPQVLPLEPDDPVDPFRILYVYKEGSIYNRRFEQRQQMKQLLGRRHRRLVTDAKNQYTSLGIFLDNLCEEDRQAIRRILRIDARTFWRLAKGKAFMELPARDLQLELPFDEPQ